MDCKATGIGACIYVYDGGFYMCIYEIRSIKAR
jgi:hypothetical protein